MSKAAKVAIASICLILIGCLIASGVLTDWGNVKVSTICIASEDGKTLSANLFVPSNASNDTPAPAVLVMHGYVNQKEHQNPLAIELSRRGYVVIALDLAGHGYSEELDKDGGVATGTSTDGVSDALKYLATLPFVDSANIAVLGHSLGGINSYCATIQNPGLVRTLVLVGSCPITPTLPDSNMCIIFDQFDEFTGAFWPVSTSSEIPSSDAAKAMFGTTEDIKLGTLYGDFANNTAKMLFTEKTTHPGEIFRTMPIGDAIRFIESSSPSANAIDPYSQVWQWNTFGTLLGLIGFVMSIFAFGSLLLKTKFFSVLVQAPAARSVRLKKGGWWTVGLVTAAIPVFSFLKYFNGATMPATRLFPITYSNAMMVWSLVNAACFLVIFLVIHFTTKKSKTYAGDFVTYGLSTNSQKAEFKWSHVGKTFLLAVTTLGIPYVLLDILNRTYHYDYRFIVVPFHPLDYTHFKLFLVYLIPLFVFFLITGTFMTSRLATKAYTGWKAILSYVAGFLLSSGGLIVLYLILYIPMFSTGHFGLTWSFDLAIQAVASWQMIPLIGFTSIIATFFYKKTSNVYLGAFISALFITWYTVALNMIQIAL
ncbi:MAG: alpha/beta fold hydrolase [Eubacteriales bacterium]|nr:alpha/beta fold hydrolase [Eubacteriales bacterium]